MLTGRDLRTGVALLVTTKPELVVEVDIALPGRDMLVVMLFGVISPDRSPKVFQKKCFLFRNLRRIVSMFLLD